LTDSLSSIAHPILGELLWDSKRSVWSVRGFIHAGKRFTVIIKPGKSEALAFLENAARLFPRLLEAEPDILNQAIRTKLLETYNASWRQDDNVLTPESLGSSLKLSLVEFASVFPVTLWYGAGKLFGGHDVAILLDEELQYQKIELRG
jgi:hypothetical protein